MAERAERAAAEAQCPTCGGTGPDSFDRDFDSGMLEAACGDEWHDSQALRDATTEGVD